MARPTFIADEPPAEGSEEARRLQEAAAEVEQLADGLLDRLRLLSQVRRGRLDRQLFVGRGCAPNAACSSSVPAVFVVRGWTTRMHPPWGAQLIGQSRPRVSVVLTCLLCSRGAALASCWRAWAPSRTAPTPRPSPFGW